MRVCQVILSTIDWGSLTEEMKLVGGYSLRRPTETSRERGKEVRGMPVQVGKNIAAKVPKEKSHTSKEKQTIYLFI